MMDDDDDNEEGGTSCHDPVPIHLPPFPNLLRYLHLHVVPTYPDPDPCTAMANI